MHDEEQKQLKTTSIISINNEFTLDKCPKCKKTICNHTSVANFHDLLRGGEDISIYSSDFTFKFKDLQLDDNDNLSIYFDDESILPNSSRKGNNKRISRPISCNVVLADRNNNSNKKSAAAADNNELRPVTNNRNSILLLKSGNFIDSGKYNIKTTRMQETNGALNMERCFLQSRIESMKSLFIFPDYAAAYRKVAYYHQPGVGSNQIIRKFDTTTRTTVQLDECKNTFTKLTTNNYTKRQHHKSSPIFLTSYHSISMILIIMLLYTINILQEYFILFDYFNTKKYYWCLSSIAILLLSQFFIIICIYMNNTASKELTISAAATSSSSSTKHKQYITEPFSFTSFIDTKTFLLNRILFLPLIFLPGLLPIVVYIEFVRYVKNFKTLTPLVHFRTELTLSFYLLLSSLFHSLPLAITNCCFLATKISHVSFSFASDMLTASSSGILNEKREALVILVSIFISITVGVCLFASYYHLMKHIHDTNCLLQKKLTQKCEFITQRTFLFSCFTIAFIHFCYKFCFITSRLIVIAILWYLLREKLFIIVFMHLLVAFLLCNFKYKSAKAAGAVRGGENVCKRQLNRHLSCFLIAILSFTDTFVDIVDRLQYFYNIHLYYLVYFIQNITIVLIWFYKIMLSMRENQNELLDKELYIVNKAIFINDHWLSTSIQSLYSIIFLSVIICLLIVGTILRYILTSMSQKLFKKIVIRTVV